MSGETVGRPMEILLVEDSLTAARLAIGALKKAPVPHRLTWLTDGEDADGIRLPSRTFCPSTAAGLNSARPDLAPKRRTRAVGRDQVGR